MLLVHRSLLVLVALPASAVLTVTTSMFAADGIAINEPLTSVENATVTDSDIAPEESTRWIIGYLEPILRSGLGVLAE